MDKLDKDKIDLSMVSPFIDYVNVLKTDQKKSLTFYTSSEYKELNSKIRSGHIIPRELKNHYDNILDCFDGGPSVNSVITVYRGMNKRYTMFENSGVISTSLSKNVTKTFQSSGCCLYIITLTPGQYTILPLMDVSEHFEEYEILLPPGNLSIQKVIPYTDLSNIENVDVIYCTYIPENSEIISSKEMSLNNTKRFNEIKLHLSIDSWINRILDSNIKEEIELLCEDFSKECILDQLKTLEFFDDIPEEAINKCLQLLENLSENI